MLDFRWLIALLLMGSTVAVAEDAKCVYAVYGIDADGSNARELAQIPDYDIFNSPEVSPDGKWVGVDGWKDGDSSTDAHLLFVNLETQVVKDLGKGAMPSWSADGRWFAYSSYSPQRVYVKTSDGTQNQLIDAEGWGIQWSPDGMRAAYVRRERGGAQLVIYDFVSRTKRDVFEDELPYQHILHNCKWSPDSSQVAFLGYRSGAGQELAIAYIDQQPAYVHVVCEADDFLPDIGWQPGGVRITLPDKTGRIRLVDRIFEPQIKPFAGQPTDRIQIGNCWTRDGKTMIFISAK